VALGQHQAVALGVIRPAAENAEERNEDLDDRERRADVPDPGSMGLLEDRSAEVQGVHERGF